MVAFEHRDGAFKGPRLKAFLQSNLKGHQGLCDRPCVNLGPCASGEGLLQGQRDWPDIIASLHSTAKSHWKFYLKIQYICVYQLCWIVYHFNEYGRMLGF